MKKSLQNLYGPYENKWVALNKERSNVLFSGSSVKEIEEKVKSSKVKDALITYVLPFNQYLCPLCLF